MEVISIERSIYEELLTSFFVLCSTFRNLALPARSYYNSEMKRKAAFLLHFTRFFVTLPLRWRTYSVSTKKETSFFVLCSTFRNFVPK